MMRRRRRVFGIIGICILAAVVSRFAPWPYPTKPPRHLPLDQASCEQQGGQWGYSGFVLLCNFRTSDGGKICSDSRRCEGECIVDEHDPGMMTGAGDAGPPSSVPWLVRAALGFPGKCTDWVITKGCITFVQNGWITRGVCAD